jgi:hypothetical protein
LRSACWWSSAEQLDARITERTIELFFKGERVAADMRSAGRGRHTTIPEL